MAFSPDQLTWRAATVADEPLLFAMFAAGKREELASLSLADEQLLPLIEMQYRARNTAYSARFPTALNMMLTLEDGTVVGHHLVYRDSEGYRSIDLVVMEAFRNRGVGSWAIQQIQALAEAECIPVSLQVLRSSRAVHLYERFGFRKQDSGEVYWQMRWWPESIRPPASAVTPHDISRMTQGAFDRDGIIRAIAAFFQELGLTVEFAPVSTRSTLPGLEIIANGIRIDQETLLYPGDMLHEAGHLAVMTPSQRLHPVTDPTDPASEMGAIAWSAAAAMHLGIPLEIVLHDQGYKGMAPQLRADVATGSIPGVPYLGWLGLTTLTTPHTKTIYPKMLGWLRTTEAVA